jgi:predicted NAD/FAD-binding protein
MRIGIVGGGIAGLTVAHHLQHEHDLTLFEGAGYAGGHTNTIDVEEAGTLVGVDTGFIVFNHRNYPGFTRLLSELGVASRPSEMSFSVRNEVTGLEYRGSSLNTLFAQRRNLFRPAFHRMVRDIVRFYREAPSVLHTEAADMPLGRYLEHNRYSALFVRDHLVPMASALWSSGPERTRNMPVGFLVRFMENHGMLNLRGRPEWRTVQGGSREYVRALTRPLGDRIRLHSPVEAVRRGPEGAWLRLGGEWIRFDRLVLALHSDQALRLLLDPSPAEREVLGAMSYQANDVVLHTDTRFLPRRRRAWSSWNYHVTATPSELPTVTYYLNRLQGLRARRHYCATLNRTSEIRPERVLRSFIYHHPVFDRAAVAAQRRHEEVSGVRDTYYCGAFWGYGFHEDGLQSGLRVVDSIRHERRAARRSA